MTTEDAVHMLHPTGIHTGIDVAKRIAVELEAFFGRLLLGKVKSIDTQIG